MVNACFDVNFVGMNLLSDLPVHRFHFNYIISSITIPFNTLLSNCTALSSPERYGDHKNHKSAENEGNKRDQENAGGKFPHIFSDRGIV